MATGALDANGIWQYGEDDSETTFSGLLNKLASSTSDTVTRLEGFTGYTGVLPIANGGTNANNLNSAQNNLRQGLVNMIPTTVTATSPGTATTTALGQVSYSGGVGVAVNGVFTSNYDNYVIKIQNLQGTLGADLGLRFRYGSTNNENATYTYAGKGRSSAGTDTNIAQVNGTYAVLGDVATTIAAMSATVNVYTPYVSQATSFQSIATNYTDSVGQVTIAGWDSQSAQNDGFYLFALTGNLNVKFTVYGYND